MFEWEQRVDEAEEAGGPKLSWEHQWWAYWARGEGTKGGAPLLMLVRVNWAGRGGRGGIGVGGASAGEASRV